MFSAAVSRPYFPLGHPVLTLECIGGKGLYGGEEGGGPFYADRVRPDGILALQGKVFFQGKIYELKVPVSGFAKSSRRKMPWKFGLLITKCRNVIF